MAEAPIKWKIETLRAIIAAPLHAQWIPTPGSQDITTHQVADCRIAKVILGSSRTF